MPPGRAAFLRSAPKHHRLVGKRQHIAGKHRIQERAQGLAVAAIPRRPRLRYKGGGQAPRQKTLLCIGKRKQKACRGIPGTKEALRPGSIPLRPAVQRGKPGQKCRQSLCCAQAKSLQTLAFARMQTTPSGVRIRRHSAAKPAGSNQRKAEAAATRQTLLSGRPVATAEAAREWNPGANRYCRSASRRMAALGSTAYTVLPAPKIPGTGSLSRSQRPPQPGRASSDGKTASRSPPGHRTADRRHSPPPWRKTVLHLP